MPVEVLILGGLGQVGEALASTAEGCGRDPLAVVQAGRGDIDLFDADQVSAALATYAPRTVVNCAVFQPVDLCESAPAQAFALNAVAVGHLAQACRGAGARLVHLSTDYVFGGGRTKPYREDDLPSPLNVYAASKLAGEYLALAASEMHMVVRTSGVFGQARAGHGTPPFIERMLDRARAGQETKVVADQTISPTYARDLARTLWGLIGCGGTGLFHVSGGGQASWFDLAVVAFEAVGARRLLRPTTAADFGAPARRADFTALDNARLRDLGMPEPPDWRDGIERYLRRAHPDLDRSSGVAS